MVAQMMNQLHLFLFLLFTTSFVGSIDFHGNQRFWTSVNNGKTNIGLHVLTERIKLTFPKDKTFADLVSDIKLFFPAGNGKCEDKTHTLGFKLAITDGNNVRGDVMIDFGDLRAFLNETCVLNGNEYKDKFYASPRIDVSNADLKNPNRRCFTDAAAPFKAYDKDTSKHVMKLEASGSIECQIFMELPQYMQIEDFELVDAPYLGLNTTFDGNNASYWWKKDNDKMIPSAVSFDGSGNVQINILNSTKEIPYFFRIGQNQPLPSLQFQFGTQCDGSQFEIYLNLRDSSECKIGIHLTQTGFQISTKNGPWKNINDATKSPILIFGTNKMYVKVASPLSIYAFETCDFTTSADVPTDQFVLQLGRNVSSVLGNCVKAQVLLPKIDVKKGIEVLIDRLKLGENLTVNGTADGTGNDTSVLATSPDTSSAGIKWWWILIGVIILIAVIAIIVIVYCICRRRRRRLQILKEQNERPKSRERQIPKWADMKSAELKEDSPKREIKEKRKSKTKTKEDESEESKKGEKPKTRLLKYNPGPHYEPPPPGRLVTFEEDVKSKSEKRSTEKTQNDATVETASTTQQTGPEPKAKTKAGLKHKAKAPQNPNDHPILKAVQKIKDEEE